MGWLKFIEGGRIIRLPGEVPLGRAPPAEGIVVPGPTVSSIHALISWTGTMWALRDLSSKNGTFLDGAPVPGRNGQELSVGSQLSLGRPRGAQLEVMSIDPPHPFARNLATGEERAEEDGQILLPDCTIIFDLEQGPRLETAEGSRPVPRVVGEWRVFLPERDRGTMNARSLQDAHLCFRLSHDLSRVGLTLRWPEIEIDLGARQWFWPLALLARARRKDGVGWVDVDRLALLSGLPRKTLDVYLGRARRLVFLADVGDAELLLEVPPRNRRIGLPAGQLDEEWMD